MLLKCAGCSCVISGDKRAAEMTARIFRGSNIATSWQTCRDCTLPFCEKCAKNLGGLFRKPKCPKCGGPVSSQYNISESDIEVREGPDGKRTIYVKGKKYGELQ